LKTVFEKRHLKNVFEKRHLREENIKVDVFKVGILKRRMKTGLALRTHLSENFFFESSQKQNLKI
jgi:hypothetical protein